jgi:DNA-binding NarL/FixJ family response regulator
MPANSDGSHVVYEQRAGCYADDFWRTIVSTVLKLIDDAAWSDAAVFVRKAAANAPPPLESFAKLYKLTAGEVRVLDAVLKVSGVKAIADLLGLSQATVKTHLNRILQKTPAKNQGELVKLVLVSEPPPEQ